MNPRRRSAANARRRAEAQLIEQQLVADDAPRTQPLIDSTATRATPCPVDPDETEETLP